MKSKQIEKTLKSLDLLILAFKAQGGYKYRKHFRLSERELDIFLAGSEANLKKMVISLMVAEEMLQEPGYWDRTPRWNKYLERRDEAMKVGVVGIRKRGQG